MKDIASYDREDQYIIDESPDINSSSEEGWAEKLLSAFPAFQSRNFIWYFSGQLISLCGTWLQIVGEGWLVLELTHSAFWVGAVTAVGTLPVLIFTLFGGVIVDRLNKQKLLLGTQLAAMVLAILLGVLTQFKVVTVVEVAILAFLLGTVNALDLPARQAFMAEMVEKEQLSSAIALSSGMFNGARAIGPAIAGIMISKIGIGGVFILNGISYIASIYTLYKMNVEETKHEIHPNPLKAIAQGVKYSFHHESIRLLLIISGLLAIFGWSYSTIMPVIVESIYHKGAETVGYFYSAFGLGALLGAIAVSVLSSRVKPRVFIIGGNTLFALCIVVFSFLNTVAPAMLMLQLAGFGIVSMFSVVTTTLQHVVSDNIRGRVMSLYTLMFLGMAPLGSLQIGFVADKVSPAWAVRIGGLFMLGCGIYLYKKRHLLSYTES